MAKKQTGANAVLFPEMASEGSREPSSYDPLPSVWAGSDAELLERMLSFYPHQEPQKILDATVNAGRFWVGSKRPVTGMDIDPKHKPDVVGDHANMPFADGSFDVVVYDPPHIPNQGRDKQKDFNDRFGLVLKATPEQGYNFSHLYPPFLAEAYRVLRADGVLFCKVADYVHGHRFQWAHVELINAAANVGFIACDCIVKIRKGPITDPRWKKAHHARRHHCYWIVLRKSKKCE